MNEQAPKKILVISVADDVHADAVSWALSKLGAEVHQWNTSAFPVREEICFRTGASGEKLDLGKPGLDLLAEEFDCIWDRRLQAMEPVRELHPDDQMPAARQADAFRRSVLNVLAESASGAFWVNPPLSDSRAASQMLQLSLARSVGLPVPETLITNDAGAVREFHQHHDGQIVFKPMRLMKWEDETRLRRTYTQKLEWHDLKDSLAFRASPGIFQKNVEKSCEVRATFMGGTSMAVRIDTPPGGDAAQDWRLGFVRQGGAPEISPMTLPACIEGKCRALMERLGILFGAFDFIVDPDGQYVFLEVNSAGQFLWVEDNAPACPMLECFCRFLLSRDPNFCWSGTADRAFALASYRDERGRRAG